MNDNLEKEFLKGLISEGIESPPSADFNKKILQKIQMNRHMETSGGFKPMNIILYVVGLFPVMIMCSVFLMPNISILKALQGIQNFNLVNEIIGFFAAYGALIATASMIIIALCLIYYMDKYIARFFNYSVQTS